jgi:NADPH2:quinone reductase
MRAVALTRYLPISNPEALVDVELPAPVPGPRDLLVRVHAIAVNPVDVKVRSPKPRVEAAPRVLGWDAAGIVEAVGGEVTLFRPGDAVYYAGDITRARTRSSSWSTSASSAPSRRASTWPRRPRYR